MIALSFGVNFDRWRYILKKSEHGFLDFRALWFPNLKESNDHLLWFPVLLILLCSSII